MRNNKTLLILASVFAVLIAFRLGQQFLSDATNSKDTDGYAQFWKDVSTADVSQLTITKTDENLDIKKQAEHAWQVADYNADTTKLEELLPRLIKPQTPVMVAETEAQHETLGISSTSATLTLTTPKGPKTVTLGSISGQGRYVKLGSAANVYLVNGLPTELDSVKTADWVDKIVTRIDQPSIAQITLKRNNDQVIIKKQDQTWKTANDVEIDTTSINPMLMTLESFATQGILSNEETKDLPKEPTLTVTVERQGQESVTLLFFEGTETTAVSLEGKPAKYSISSSTLDTFNLKQTDLKSKSS